MVMPTSGDSFISDDEEELCPLCVEEMDLSDKNFKPCPCGYQVCQFCYNNIRQNPQLNGRCPACRRPYSDETVEYRMVSQEEWKQDHQRLARKEKERKQREREKKETEQHQASKKHLSGMRVIQKNLVYVIGLNPNIPTEELHNTLRGDQFFGQYGKIQKIVINRRNNANGNPGLGVYVTFSRKEDAAKCIAAVDGSMNDGKYLRAAYGTTKYCSSYLRGQPCPNPNCMFLHEPGEEADSYTRQDLIQHATRQDIQRPSSRQVSKSHGAGSSGDDDHPSEASNGINGGPNGSLPNQSTLPASVSWAHKPSPTIASQKISSVGTPTRPKSSNMSANGAMLGSGPSTTTTATMEPLPAHLLPKPEAPTVDPAIAIMNQTLESLSQSSFNFVFSSSILTDEEIKTKALPPFFSFNKPDSTVEESISPSSFSELLSTFNKSGGLGCGNKTGAHILALGEGPSLESQLLQQQVQHPQPQDSLQQSMLSQQLLQQQQQPPQQIRSQIQFAHGQSQPPRDKPVATPPPGLMSAGAPPVQNNQNSQELLAHLMNGGARGENK